jgi:hypothetical protein
MKLIEVRDTDGTDFVVNPAFVQRLQFKPKHSCHHTRLHEDVAKEYVVITMADGIEFYVDGTLKQVLEILRNG